MILSILPATASNISDADEFVEDSLAVNVQGTRATIRNESVTFNSGGAVIPGHLYYEAGSTQQPTVIFGVGYTAQVTGLYNSSNYGWLATELADNGYTVLVVRYWANYENPMELLNLTDDYSLWVTQTKDAVTAMKTGAIVGSSVNTVSIVDPTRIALGGHSIGGAVSIVAGAQDRRIKAVFALSPQNYAGQPRMNSFIDEMSPSPVQLQVGEADIFGGVATVQQSYNAASSPKQMVSYRYGTYSGFTDLGKVQNISIDDVPSAIKDALEPILQVNPLSTKQHEMSVKYTRGFLDYYLRNDATGFDFQSDYSEGYVIGGPFPPPPIPDVWHATVSNDGLDVIFNDVSTTPLELDFEIGNTITVRARITPRGIWEERVEAILTFPEGVQESFTMIYNDAYDTSAGDFFVDIEVPITHTLGTVKVNITATDSEDWTYTYDLLSFELTTNSEPPVIDSFTISPDQMIPGETITFTISASDPTGDAIAFYFIDFGDGTNSGWVETSTITHEYTESGIMDIRVKAMDEKAAVSAEYPKDKKVSTPPEADLKVDSTVKEGNELELDASGSSDQDGDGLWYFFDYGDGIDSGWTTSSKEGHRYDETGEVTVSLTVRDDWGIESEVVTATVTVKENKGDSAISAVTSSSGFPILIVIVVIFIILGGIFLLREEEEDTTTKGTEHKPSSLGDGKRKKKMKVPVNKMATKDGEKQIGPQGPRGGKGMPPGKPSQDTKSEDKASPGKRPMGKPGERTISSPKPKEGKKRPMGGIPPGRADQSKSALPQLLKEKTSGMPITGKSGIKPSGSESEELARPVTITATEKPTEGDAPAPTEKMDTAISDSEKQEVPLTQKGPQIQTQIPKEPKGEPEIDAPPIEEENWDDFSDGDDHGTEDDDSDESGDQGNEWEDEDFAIPVALKEKLQKESE